MLNLKKALTKFKELDKQKKIVIGFIIFGFFLLIIILVLSPKSMSPPSVSPTNRPTPTPTPTPILRKATMLFLSPAYKNLKVGESLPVTVNLAKEMADSVNVVLHYDPKFLAIEAVKNGKIFPKIDSQKNEKGKLTITAGKTKVATSSPTIVLKTAEVFFGFTLKALNATSSAVVYFDPKETTTDKNGFNILGLTMGGSYRIDK